MTIYYTIYLHRRLHSQWISALVGALLLCQGCEFPDYVAYKEEKTSKEEAKAKKEAQEQAAKKKLAEEARKKQEEEERAKKEEKERAKKEEEERAKKEEEERAKKEEEERRKKQQNADIAALNTRLDALIKETKKGNKRTEKFEKLLKEIQKALVRTTLTVSDHTGILLNMFSELGKILDKKRQEDIAQMREKAMKELQAAKMRAQAQRSRGSFFPSLFSPRGNPEIRTSRAQTPQPPRRQSLRAPGAAKKRSKSANPASTE